MIGFIKLFIVLGVIVDFIIIVFFFFKNGKILFNVCIISEMLYDWYWLLLFGVGMVMIKILDVFGVVDIFNFFDDSIFL